MPESPAELISVGAVVAGLLVLGIAWLALVAPWWLRAKRAGLNLSPKEVLGLRLRKAPVGAIIRAAAAANEAQLPVTVGMLEVHALAGGHPEALIRAMVEARARGEEAPLDDVVALDLAGVDVVALARDGERLTGLLGSERAAALGDRYRKRG